ncbi:MAG: ribosome small subunit-dependent GTPase A [Christensenellales bacterium]|jgi:ribosome biogenesis GTPase
MEGIVIKKIADSFVVKIHNESYVLSPRGNLKKDGIFVGDNVIVNLTTKTIDKLLPRKNLLVRPTTANLSQLIITVAPIPKPDFNVVDKLILFCFAYDINPILCVNKIDIADEEFLNYVKSVYSNVCKIVFVSAKEKKNLEELKHILSGHISALTGQSAVGKSHLLSEIYQNSNVEIGELSKKVARGKNTTRHTELYCLEENTFLADTPGFSRLDERFLPIEYHKLRYYYPDFLPLHEKCKYTSCTHINEPEKECFVKLSVKQGNLDADRYERYKTVYEILKKEQTYAKK